jgi:hypothetical protein
MCIYADWSEGYMVIVNSKTTEKIFILSSMDFKEEYIQFMMAENECINSNNNEDLVKEIKEKIT